MADPITIAGQIPQTYEELLQLLQSMGVDTTTLPSTITSIEELTIWMQQSGYQPIYTVQNVLSGFAKVGGDVATTNAVTLRPVTDIVVGSGGAAGAVAMLKGLSWGLIGKKILIGAIVAALGISTLAGLNAVSLAIDNVLDDYTIDGENVAGLVDENGLFRAPLKAIEAVRDALIKADAFFTETTVKVDPVSTAFWTSELYPMNRPFDQQSLDIIPPLAVIKDITFPPEGIVTKSGSIFRAENPSDFYLLVSTRFKYGNYPQYLECVMVRKAGSSSKLYENNGEKTLSNPNYKTIVYNGVEKRVSDYVNGFYYLQIETLSAEYANGLIDRAGSTIPTFYNTFNPGSHVWIMFSESEISGGLDNTEVVDSTAGDSTQTIPELFPTWANQAINIPTPTDEDINNVTPYYPISLDNVNPDTTATPSTSTDKDGDVSPEVQPQIMDLLKEIITIITGTPEPEVPVEDSGTTPPFTPPLLSGASNALWTIYNPSLAQVQQFGGWLWSESILDQIIRMFNSPIDAVIGFHMMYATPITGGQKEIKAGYLNSGVSAAEVTNQYITIDCGTVTVPEYYGTALDYIASQVYIFLPFIGIQALDTSVVTGSQLNVVYRIDVLTGTCLAQIKVIKRNSSAVMYAFSGNCAVQLPLTATTYTGMASALLNLGAAGLSAMTGDIIGIGSDLGNAARGFMKNKAGVAKSGSFSANVGALGIRVPYLIIVHPTAYDAGAYNRFYGFPANRTVTLSTVSGYCRVKSIHLESIPCTDDERAIIDRELKEGIIIQ